MHDTKEQFFSDEFVQLDATAQAELIRRGEVQPRELVEAAIARIERLNPQLNAVITSLFEKARTQAVASHLPDGPFRGVPLLLKDFLCETAGDPYYERYRGVHEEELEDYTMSPRAEFLTNLEEVIEELHYLNEPVEQYRSRRRLGKATGAERIGVNYSRLRPGQVSSKFHFHTREEEFLLILSGRAMLRFGDASYELQPGDAVSLKPGGPAHQLRNDFAEECIYLEIGIRDPEDSIIYPEDRIIRKGNATELLR